MFRRILASALALAFALLALTGCTVNEAAAPMAELGLDAKGTRIISSYDTHGGFHGDGTTYYCVGYQDDHNVAAIEANPAWHPLPMSDNVTNAVYSLMVAENGSPMFPVIMSGYYYFEDRHSQSTDPLSDADLLDRHSYNFTVALYCTNTNVVHYAAIDT